MDPVIVDVEPGPAGHNTYVVAIEPARRIRIVAPKHVHDRRQVLAMVRAQVKAGRFDPPPPTAPATGDDAA